MGLLLLFNNATAPVITSQPGYILRITDGVTTCDFSGPIGQTGYGVAPNAWSPNVAGLRKSLLGGAGPYEDVVEQIPVIIFGSSAADALARLAALRILLDQAARWARGDAANPALLQYQPEGCTQLLQAAILGRPEGAQEMALPPTFNSELAGWVIDPVSLQILRRGLWLGPAETAGPMPAGNPADVIDAVTTLTWPSSQPIPSPVKLDLWLAGQTQYLPSYLLVASSPSHIAFVEAESVTLAAHWTSVPADAQYVLGPRGGAILRYTPAATTPSSVIGGSLTSPTGARRASLFACVCNNSATATYELTIGLANPTTLVAYSAPVTPITPTVSVPSVVFLGTVSLLPGDTISAIKITAQASIANASLDIDWVCALFLMDDTARAIKYDMSQIWPYVTGYVTVDAAPLTKPSPEFYWADGGNRSGFPYSGDIFPVSSGHTVCIAVLSTQGTQYTWEGTLVGQKIMLGTRYPAFLTPQ